MSKISTILAVLLLVRFFAFGQAVVDGENNWEFMLHEIPPQPNEGNWGFIKDLKGPLWNEDWIDSTKGDNYRTNEYANLSHGIRIIQNFPDPDSLLITAYNDLNEFFSIANIEMRKKGYIIELEKVADFDDEEYKIEVRMDKCRVFASSVEGIRRGIYEIEDILVSQRAPLLPIETLRRKPFLKKRISRSFFSPIKRPPAMRDELIDSVDYYPDNFLNRLSHEGVNGLWLTITFNDLVRTRFTPEGGKNRIKRLEKLKQTVKKCGRYGIKIYIFCIEPVAWGADDLVLKAFPELGGVNLNQIGYHTGSKVTFCPSSKAAQEYLYESTYSIFNAVPGLGGLINISHGERMTTCLSSLSATQEFLSPIKCPRCSKLKPWQILFNSLSAMEKGMHAAAPDAAFISWLYMPQPQQFYKGDSYSLGKWVYDLPAHTPKNVILQFNFTSGVTANQLGNEMVGGDYWLSQPGPSDRFRKIATIASISHTDVSAKIQTSTSHEITTVPYVPVPSLLYEKFLVMKELGVETAMLSWYFGNDPGLMNKAMGLLSFRKFRDEDQFLTTLASLYWRQTEVPTVVKAWRKFADSYRNFPLTNMFQYYGPMHDGVAWPLYLTPKDAPLSPTWLLGSTTTLKAWPPSGDRIGECLGGILSLDEGVELCNKMSAKWEEGMLLLNQARRHYKNNEQKKMVHVAEAVGIQLKSGYDVLRFYSIREKLLRTDMESKSKMELLDTLEKIINEEIQLDQRLSELASENSRLGFHPEAEGYKYYPTKLKWRVDLLEKEKHQILPKLRSEISSANYLYPGYTGKKPTGSIVYVNRIGTKAFDDQNIQMFEKSGGESYLGFKAGFSDTNLYVIISDSLLRRKNSSNPYTKIQLNIEQRRLWPVRKFEFNLTDSIFEKQDFTIEKEKDILTVILKVPLKEINISQGLVPPLRMNIEVYQQNGTTRSWLTKHPLTARLMLGTDNPEDLGWLIFKD